MATEEEQLQLLLSSLISDIKCYSGSDPLRPWLRGIKRLRAGLPPHALQEKLPRFLQKCAQTFQSDCRYANDARYVRVWIELMDFVDDAKPLLKKMEKHQIGLKRASFYIAYALYYEKHRKLQDADRMYHAGVQILAEPVSELQKSYDQFLQRLDLYNKRKSQQRMPTKKGTTREEPIVPKGEGTSENPSSNVGLTKQDKPRPEKAKSRTRSTKTTARTSSNNLTRYNSENTIMVCKFVDSAIVGKSTAEMLCHNGLVEPTITTKEAMHDINDMFQEPLDLDPTVQRKSHRTKGNKTQSKENSGFEIFADEEERTGKFNINPGKIKPFMGDFAILPDEEEANNLNRNLKNTSHGLKEDTMMFQKFVGSTVSEEPKLENACHHGLVDPTMNLKEAMDAINGMFRKPMNMGDKPRRGQKVLGEKKTVVDSCFSILPDDELGENMNPAHKPNTFPDSSFSILPDDELEDNTDTTSKPNNVFKGESPKMGKSGFGDKPVDSCGSSNSVIGFISNPTCKNVEGGGSCDGLFEPTFFTRQAMDDINELFGKEIDF